MTSANRPLRKLGFLTMGLFDEADPFTGHQNTLQLIALGEELGFDSVWLRQRHLQFGISSPVAVLAAASQLTERIEFGTAVIPLGLENPLRLAEDLATVDVLSGGRLNPGLSVGPPMRFDDFKTHLYPDSWEQEDFSYTRVERLLHNLRGEPVSSFAGKAGVVEEFSNRVQPHSPGLAERVWYGAGSLRSAQWAGEQNLNLLVSSVTTAEDSADFDAAQSRQIELFRERHRLGGAARVSQGLVVIPTDHASAEQKLRYRGYAASRLERTRSPQGPRRMLFAPDLVGDSSDIAEQLAANRAFRMVDEVAFALPFSFEPEDYRQILSDIAGSLAPKLGWVRPGNPGPN
ncbi:MAG: LLM class flavin-dependent oxidoreductase [Renibacterium sp.]|nr:LLM class flavin-dependent oxidoreductase [Renibacterium sp.]